MILYRGMSHNELKEANINGFFRSLGTSNAGHAEDCTCFSTDYWQAAMYARGGGIIVEIEAPDWYGCFKLDDYSGEHCIPHSTRVCPPGSTEFVTKEIIISTDYVEMIHIPKQA